MKRIHARKVIGLLMLIGALLCASCALAQTAQLPAALMTIADEAFMGDSSLENVILPEKLTGIGSKAFADCVNMESIYIPDSVTEIADDAFAGCEHLTFRCGWGSYAAVFAAKHIAQYPGCSVEMLGEMPQDVSVSLSVSRLMCEGGEIDLVWEVTPSIFQSGDLCELVVMLNGEEYKRFEKSSSLRYELRESHETALTGEMYAICYYEHADGTTSQAISEKTQLVGGMTAELSAMDYKVLQNEYTAWELSVQGAAGTPVVQYTVYRNSEVYAQSGYVTDLQYRIVLTKAGTYTAEAAVVDGLGREAIVQSGSLTVPSKGAKAEYLTYRLSDDGTYYIVTGCDVAAASSITIPQKRNNLYIREIAEGAFIGCENITGVSISPYVTKIGAYAFHGCSSIKYITGLKYTPSGISEVQIGEGAFSDCAKLDTLELPSVLKEIPARLVEGSEELQYIEFPNNLTSIGERAFENCTKFKQLYLPSTVRTIGRGAFKGCSELASVTFGSGLNTIGAEAFADCTALTNVSLPEGLTEIAESTFAGCSALVNIQMPQTIKTIGDRAFAVCEQIEELVLPESLQQVGASAFSGCTGLRLVTFENEDTQLSDRSFAYCPDVELRYSGSGAVEEWALEAYITHRNTALPEIKTARIAEGEYAAGLALSWLVEADWGLEPYAYVFSVFCDNESIAQSESLTSGLYMYVPQKAGTYSASVTVTDANGNSASAQIQGVEVKPSLENEPGALAYKWNSSGTGYVITGLSVSEPDIDYDIIIPAEIDGVPVKEIGTYAFQDYKNIKTLVIMNDLDAIGKGAFRRCMNLERVVLPANLDCTLNGEEFYGCRALTDIILPYGIKTVPSFEACYSLRRLHIPETVTNIPSFKNCDQLTEVICDSKAVPLFQECDKLERVKFTAPIVSIDTRDAFRDCTSLEMITGIEHVTGIADAVFAGCTSLTEITLPAEVEYIQVGMIAFSGCTNLKKVNLSEKCRGIRAGDSAFFGCRSLEEIRVTSAGQHAFENCTSLKKVVNLSAASVSAFLNCTALTSIVSQTGDAKQLIFDDRAFKNCRSLSYIEAEQIRNWSATETYMNGDNAFEGCTSLTEVKLAKGAKLCDSMFKDCTSLKKVVIEDVYTFGSAVFMNCVSLEDININGSGHDSIGYTGKTISRHAFANCQSLTKLEFCDNGRYPFKSIDDEAFVGCTNLVVDTTNASQYVKDYFAAHPEFAPPAAGELTVSITGDVYWDELDPADGTVKARITVYNTKDGPAVSGEEWAQALEAAKMKNAGLAVYSSCMSVRHLGDKEATYPADTAAVVHPLGDLAYRSSASAIVELQCRSENPASCKHGDLRVLISSDGRDDVLITSPAAVKYTDEYAGDYTVEKETTLSGDLTVNGNVHVKALLNLNGAKLKATGDVILYEGGTVRMTGKSGLTAQEIDIQQGGALEMDGFAQVSAESLSDAGLLSLMSDACWLSADAVSVTGAGVLAMDENGTIDTQSFLFDTASDHSGMLSDGVITAHTAQMKQNFRAGGKHVFILQGGTCTLDVERTSPKQHFASMAIDCGIGNLTVEGYNALLGLPFECDHFVLSEESVLDQVKKSNSVFKEIYEKYTAAKYEKLAAEEETLAKEMDGWYSLTLSSGDVGGAKKAATYAKKALVRWAVGSAAEAPDKWSDVNDVLRTILAANTGASYTYKEGIKTYEVTVEPLGGLSTTQAAVSAGTVECACGGETYEFVFSLNHHGVQQGAGRILDVMHQYAEDEYLSNIHKAVEEVVGKEYAKYALGMLKVVEQSIDEEKELYQVILEKYGKEPAEKLIKSLMPKARIQAAFYSKWDKYIKPFKDFADMAEETRKGKELPTDLMREFLKLAEKAL